MTRVGSQRHSKKRTIYMKFGIGGLHKMPSTAYHFPEIRWNKK